MHDTAQRRIHNNKLQALRRALSHERSPSGAEAAFAFVPKDMWVEPLMPYYCYGTGPRFIGYYWEDLAKCHLEIV